MSTLKKVIFLSNNEKNKGMGILKLEKKNNNIFGNIKTYQDTPNENYILGIKIDNKVIKQNVNFSNNTYSFVMSENFNLDSTLGCVLMRISNNEITPILWGNEKNQNFKTSIVSSLKESMNKLNINTKLKSNVTQTHSPIYNTIYNEKNNLSENKSLNNQFNNFEDVNTQDEMKNNHNQDKCQHANYTFLNWDKNENEINKLNLETQHKEIEKISFEPEEVYSPIYNEIAVASSKSMLFEDDDEELEKTIDKEINKIEDGNHKFYDMISDQLKELFERYPKEANLSKLIDNSEWVKINSDDDNKYYVVGIIYHNHDIKYICYGVPGTYENEPPVEMRHYSQWLPTDISNPYTNGYWVMYQDADTGENIFIN